MNERLTPAGLRAPASPHRAVWAAVVCHNPCPQSLAALVGVLGAQVEQILLIDNAAFPTSALSAMAGPGVRYLPMPGNLGTGAALNHAWGLALAESAWALVSFDQDSLPDAGMVPRLMATWCDLEVQGRRPAAVGPVQIDRRTRRIAPVLAPIGWRRRSMMPRGEDPIRVDHLITSGCLVPAGIRHRLGPLAEGLFLDYTDIEWSLRARAAGMELYVDPEASMTHAIGDDLVRIGSRLVPRHQPVRGYLQVRNHLLLWRFAGVPRLWLLRDLPRQFGKHLLLSLRGPRRLARLAWVLRGVIDGLRGRDGPPPARREPAPRRER